MLYQEERFLPSRKISFGAKCIGIPFASGARHLEPARRDLRGGKACSSKGKEGPSKVLGSCAFLTGKAGARQLLFLLPSAGSWL